jgi:tetratricopeptide (TPR) repeat protein
MTPGTAALPRRSILVRFWRSRLFSVLVAGVGAFALVTLVWNLAISTHWGRPRLQPVLDPKTLETSEQVVREHIHDARAAVDELSRDKRTSARQLAPAYAELGKIYLVYHFPEPAVVCFQNAIALDPDEFRWRYFQAHAFQRASDMPRAAAAMTSAVERLRRDVTAKPVDFDAAMAFIGEASIRLNKPADAKAAFAAVLRHNPKHLFSLIKLGQIASQAGDSREAVHYFESARLLSAQLPEVNRLLAAEYRRLGDMEKAASFPVPQSFQRKATAIAYADALMASLEGLNRSSVYWRRLANQKSELGRWADALALSRRAVLANPESPNLRALYGDALLMMGRVAEAREQIAKARSARPGAPGIRSSWCLVNDADPATREQALADALAWRRESPNELEAVDTIALIWRRRGQYSKSLDAYRDAARLAPDESWPLLGETITLSLLGRYAEARSLVEDTMARFPDDSNARMYLGRLLAAAPADAVRDPKRALQMMRELAAAQPSAIRNEGLAIALAANGKFDEAVPLQRTVVESLRAAAAPVAVKRAEAVLACLEAHKPWRERSPLGGPQFDGPQ